jgi:hypothetical protein
MQLRVAVLPASVNRMQHNSSSRAEWRCHWHLQASAGLLLQVATLLLPVSTAAADVV